ncbi:hypothetical protein [uncultured Dokdonia sp.]|jgi:uncharacterized membrane protein|uniref:hypothetical protein n=1 Tax=uncultured Dokdonia sp. TaxID=575653 RepID=UPI00260C780C|nr:hypothetical protein [uncultured Dokdonia sp.]
MNHIKYLLATIAAFTFVMFIVMFPVLLKAQEKMPDDMYEFAAPMTFMCVDSFTRMMEILEKDYQEIPMVISHLTPSMSMVLFVNHDSTTSTVVVTKRTKEKEQACIVFGGASNGTSFSLNPNPAFPVET